jgi:hypothetical protein
MTTGETDGTSTEPTGIIAYDLAGRYHCEECGQPLMNRLLFDTIGSCESCNTAITRHRCTAVPDRDSFQLGENWDCPDCGSTWTAIEEDDTCGECGRDGLIRKTWDYQPGPRLDEAPRRVPAGPYTPFRNAFTDRSRCYRTAAGAMVHVRPGCECRKR